jgi:hypothetical protein
MGYHRCRPAGACRLPAVRNGRLNALVFVDSIGLDQRDQFRIRLAELHTDAVRIHMPDGSRYRVVLRSIGLLEQEMDIDMITIPECQDTPIRVALKQQALFADISHPASLRHRFFADQNGIKVYWNAGVSRLFHS